MKNMRFSRWSTVLVGVSMLMVMAFATVNTAVATETGYWKFDESSGSSAADSSGCGNVGTLVGSGPTWVAGRLNNALHFNGGNDYVNCANNSGLSSATGSIEFWIKTDYANTPMDIIHIFDYPDAYADFLLINKNSNGSIGVAIADGGVYKVAYYTGKTIADTNWHHIVATQDGTGVKIYIDGEFCPGAGTNSAYWTTHLAINAFRIGWGAWYGGFYGMLDEVKIYNNALSADDIRAHYLQATLIGYWKFDDASGSSAADSSIFGNTGTLSTGAAWVDGRLGKALQFSSDGYVICNNTQTLQSLKSEKGSIEFWMKANDTGSNMDLFQLCKDGYENCLLIRRNSNGNIGLAIIDNNVLQVGWNSSTTIDTNWHHIVFTQDGTGVKIYIDGVLTSGTGTNSSTYWTSYLTVNWLWIGKSAWYNFSGILDNVKIYNKALTASEISQEYYEQGGTSGFGCEANPTGNPIGGGAGYSPILTSGNYTVSTKSGLLSALASATSGQVIYVDPAASIDLTGSEGMVIPTGVTLASNRGYNGSAGVLLYSTTQFSGAAIPLFTTGGSGVNITGLRMYGPSTQNSTMTQLSNGILLTYPVEVNNCEIWGWTTGVGAGNYSGSGSNIHIHHNYIHDCQQYSLGYGIYVSNSSALVEANKFDRCRHSVAGYGCPGSGYEARYNLIASNSVWKLHNFDMHGETDYRNSYIKAIWRFDEDSGTTACDSALVGYQINGTLNNLATACWQPGKVKNGLSFNGAGYVSCNDSTARQNLKSTIGSIEFWINPDDNTARDIIYIGADTNNYLIVGKTANGIQAKAKFNGGTVQTVTSSYGTITNGAWNHVVVTRGTTGAKIYINGSTATTGDMSSWTNFSSSIAYCWIGASGSSNFKGILDEVRIYSQELSASDVALHNTDGHADRAGDYIDIHHNTFQITNDDVLPDATIRIRGLPNPGAAPDSNGTHGTTGGVYIHNNWFYQSTSGVSVTQAYTQGYLYIFDNIFTTDRTLEK